MAKRRAQVVLTLMPGAEPWLRVEHAHGWFKVPGTVAALELLAGALEGWTTVPRALKDRTPRISVPAIEWARLQALDVSSPAAGAPK